MATVAVVVVVAVAVAVVETATIIIFQSSNRRTAPLPRPAFAPTPIPRSTDMPPFTRRRLHTPPPPPPPPPPLPRLTRRCTDWVRCRRAARLPEHPPVRRRVRLKKAKGKSRRRSIRATSSAEGKTSHGPDHFRYRK